MNAKTAKENTQKSGSDFRFCFAAYIWSVNRRLIACLLIRLLIRLLLIRLLLIRLLLIRLLLIRLLLICLLLIWLLLISLLLIRLLLIRLLLIWLPLSLYLQFRAGGAFRLRHSLDRRAA